MSENRRGIFFDSYCTCK